MHKIQIFSLKIGKISLLLISAALTVLQALKLPQVAASKEISKIFEVDYESSDVKKIQT